MDQLDWEPGKNRLLGKTPAVLTMGAKQAGTVAKLLRGRLLKGKELTLTSQNLQVVLESAQDNGFKEGDNYVRIGLSEAAVQELSATLLPVEGEYKLSTSKGLMVRVRKTYIKDQEGNVVDTMG
ncbi:hypothetical protein D3C76_1184470 [compost metagenome]